MLFSGVAHATEVVTDKPHQTEEGRLYWSTSNGTILRAKFDGTEQETVIIGMPLANPVFNAAGTQMYGISHDGVIRRINADGTGMTEVLDPGENPVLLRIDTVGGKLYWVDNSRIRRANLEGGPPEDLIELSATPSDFVLNLAQSQVVWESNGVLERAQLDGSGRQTILWVPDFLTISRWI